MDKINKEELMQKLQLTEEDLEKVTGGISDLDGWNINIDCFNLCMKNESATRELCIKTCTDYPIS